MNTRTMKRPAALLTALCLLIALLPSAAVEAETMQEQPSLSTSSTLTETSNIIPTLETVAQDCKILNYVDEAVFRQNNHLSRLESEESLDNYVFLNQDGSKTVYYMGEAVKYRDSTGTIREKDITLTLRNGNYTTTQNNVLLSIPTNLSNSIRLNYEGYQVSLQPQGGSMLTLPRLVDNTVSYTNYFGTGMTLNYTPTLSGLKEEIVLSSYTGVNSFSFLLNTGGLTLYQSKDGYYLAENAAEPKIRLGDIIIFDAIGKPDEGTLTVSTVTPGQQYRLTVSADPEFLTDPETVYPVTIDPTLTVSDNTYGAGAIADAPIFQGLPNGNFGNFPFNRVGNAGGNYGVGRTVVRLTGLINDAAYRETSSNQVSSVVFYIREGSGKSGTVVNLHPLTSNSTWSETGVTWNTANTYDSTPAATVTLTGNRFAAFDITGLAQNWKQNVYNANCGFVLISTTETTGNNALCSSEYTTTDWRPYVVATYQYSSETLSVGEGSTRALTPPDISSTITWASSNTAIATVNSSGVVTGVKAGYAEITASVNGSVEKTYKLYVTLADGVYYLQNALSGYFLTAQNGEIGNGTPLLASTKYATTTDTVTRLRQMFKIKHLGSGRYSVRPMHKLNMGLDVTSDDLDIWNINTTDTLTGVPSYGQWTIQWDTNGYVFTNQSYGLTMQSTSTTLNARVVTGTSTSSAGSRWVLTKMTEPLVGIYLYDTLNKQVVTTPTKYVAPGETRTLSSMSLACIAYSPWTIDQSVTWSSYYQASVASDGTVTGLFATGGNTIYVTARKIMNGYDRSVSFKVIVTEISQGTHFIRSKSSGKYVDIQNQDMQDGTVIHQWDFLGRGSQRWIFTHLGDGTYSIKSANSTDNLYLGVSNNSTTNNAAVVLRVGAVENGMKWKVFRTSSGFFKIRALTGEGNDYDRVLALEIGNAIGQANSNGDVLQQRDYVDDANYKDEWYIQPLSLTLSTPLIAQTTNMWCWAASAQMLVRTFWPTAANNGDSTTTIAEQQSAVYHVLGPAGGDATEYDWLDDPLKLKSSGGLFTDVGNAAAYLTSATEGENTYTASISPYDEENIIHFLVNGSPVVRLYGWVKYDASLSLTLDDLPEILEGLNKDTVGGHVTVISGVQWDESQSCYLFTVHDPEFGGSRVMLPYSSLMFNIYTEQNVNKAKFWFPTVVVKQPYCTETFLEDSASFDYTS